jgi:hypothetical protein
LRGGVVEPEREELLHSEIFDLLDIDRLPDFDLGKRVIESNMGRTIIYPSLATLLEVTAQAAGEWLAQRKEG